MSLVEECLKNLEISISELRIALQAEQIISSPESITNQKELSTEELLKESNIRF